MLDQRLHLVDLYPPLAVEDLGHPRSGYLEQARKFGVRRDPLVL